MGTLLREGKIEQALTWWSAAWRKRTLALPDMPYVFSQQYFYPRPWRGRLFHIITRQFLKVISIHAPRRERPWTARPLRFFIPNFNPRSPKGATSLILLVPACIRYFNPRSPKGATALRLWKCRSCLYFNPRSPKGATIMERYLIRPLPYFNPRSPKGATALKDGAVNKFQISIHAPRRERRMQ